jgi:CRISPR/Cas system-associated exonuclease Cas4 (RecB family)
LINNHSNWHFNHTDVLNTNNIRYVDSGCQILDFNFSNKNLPKADSFQKNIDNDYPLTSKDVIRKINPIVLPRISAIANIGLCERAAYNISFFGMESDNNFTAEGVIGNAIHRITLRSIMEITQSLKNGSSSNAINSSTNITTQKSKAKEIFIRNAERDIKINWKRFMLSNIENPLPSILDDLEIRSDRLIHQLFAKEEEADNKQIIFRPEFTIRNIKIPLEGRLDLIKIKLLNKQREKENNNYNGNKFLNPYVTAEDLVNLEKESVEIIQIKTGNYRPRTAVWNLQADAEALLLMQTLNLKEPPKYTWQFADKDGNRKKFDFAKVSKVIDKYIQIWKSEISPQITGFCPKCPLRKGCLNWAFVSNNALTEDERIKRNIEFRLSKRIREEISLDDRWKAYVVLQSAEKRQREGSAITNLYIDTSSIDAEKQKITLLGDEYFGQFLDFSVGEHVTISDGTPNLGSNPNAVIRAIDIDRKSITLEFYRDDLYYLLYDNREKSPLTIDRFNFSSGLISMKFLDSFFRLSSYADDIVLKKRSVKLDEQNIIGMKRR